MEQVAPGKMIALCECEAIPNPDKITADGPKWLYCLPWWPVGKKHTAEPVKRRTRTRISSHSNSCLNETR